MEHMKYILIFRP